MIDVIEHLSAAEQADALREAYRVLRPGGRILIHTMPNRLIYDVTYRVQRSLRPRRWRTWPADPRNATSADARRRADRRSLRRSLAAAGFDRRSGEPRRMDVHRLRARSPRPRDLPPPRLPPAHGCARQRRPVGRGAPAARGPRAAAELGIVIPTLGRRWRAARARWRRLERQRGEPGASRWWSCTATRERRRSRRDGAAVLPRQTPDEPDTSASAQRNAGWRRCRRRWSCSSTMTCWPRRPGRPPICTPTRAARGGGRRARPRPLGAVAQPTPFMRWLERGHPVRLPRSAARRGRRLVALLHGQRIGHADAARARRRFRRGQRFPFGYEDLDLAARMAEHGFRLRYVPGRAGRARCIRRRSATGGCGCAGSRLPSAGSARATRARGPTSAACSRTRCRQPPARGRGARLAWIVPRRTPWLGARVWASFDLWHRQQLAPGFLAAWEQAGNADDRL